VANGIKRTDATGKNQEIISIGLKLSGQNVETSSHQVQQPTYGSRQGEHLTMNYA